MTTKAVEIFIAVVYTPMDDAIGSDNGLITREEAAQEGTEFLCDTLTEIIPEGFACTIIKGWKDATNDKGRD